jgi:hypothetical protein
MFKKLIVSFREARGFPIVRFELKRNCWNIMVLEIYEECTVVLLCCA